MPTVLEVVEKLKERVARDLKLVETSRRELETLQEVAVRIADLEIQLDEARIRIIRTISMLGDKQTKEIFVKNPALVNEFRKFSKASKYSRSERVSLRAFMQEYLRIVKEARVGDIVVFLRAVGVDYAQRQTI